MSDSDSEVGASVSDSSSKKSTVYDSSLTLNSLFIQENYYDFTISGVGNFFNSASLLDISFQRHPPSEDEVRKLYNELDEIMPPDDRIEILEEFKTKQIVSDEVTVSKLLTFMKAVNTDYYPKSTKRNIRDRLKSQKMRKLSI